MTDAEKYLFDLNGYLVVEGALTAESLAALNALVDARAAADMAPEDRTRRWGGLLEWGKPFRDLIDNPRVTPYLHELVDVRARLDHDYLDLIRRGLGPIGATLHGGGAHVDAGQFFLFKNGKMHNGLTVVAYALRDVHPGDGGFACIPGSHKANYPLPDGWADMSERLAPGVRAVPCRAGDAVLFTEALTHGTLPWRGEDERRTVFFKYSPHPCAWAVPPYDPTAYDDISPEARRMLEGANARYRGRRGGVD